MKRWIDPSQPGPSKWERADAMTDDEIEAAALADPDCLPVTPERAAKFRRGPHPRLIRAKLGLTQEAFAARFHLPLGTIRDWEQGKHEPDSAAKVLLRLIDKDPEAIAKALAS